jgi:hypothetical protein
MTLKFTKPHSHRDKAYRAFIVPLPCACCGRPGPSQFAHMRSLGGGGMGLKPPDLDAIPLCAACHMEVEHAKGISELSIDPCKQVLKYNRMFFMRG